MIHSAIYVENDSLLSLEGLVNQNGTPVTDAVVTLNSFVDKNGNAVTGITTPGSLAHTSGGTYQLQISRDAEFVAGRLYYATVTATSGGIQAQWTETVLAKRRAA